MPQTQTIGMVGYGTTSDSTCTCDCKSQENEQNARISNLCSAEWKQSLRKPDSSDTLTPNGPIALPNVSPSFEVKWGDGPNDQIETEDFEVLCIAALNPYPNIVLKDVTITSITLTRQDGTTPELLPNGVPSLMVKPDALICFGDLPARQRTDRLPHLVYRQVVLKASNAKAGNWLLTINACFSVEIQQSSCEAFTLPLVDS